MLNSETGEAKEIIVRVASKFGRISLDYIEDRRKDVGRVLSALERHDYDKILILAHSMKGSGGAFGFDGITDLGRHMERAAKNQEPEEIRRVAAKLWDYVDRVEVVSD